MSVTRIATRYAKSLMELAIEQGKLTQVSADMISLAKASRNRERDPDAFTPPAGYKQRSILDG